MYGKAAKNKKAVDESIYRLLGITPQSKLADTDLAKRCVYLMLNEAARCLDEGIVRNARDGDIGAIFGIGFPPFLGGPFSAIDNIGTAQLVEQLQSWSEQFGERYTPCEALVEMAKTDAKYY